MFNDPYAQYAAAYAPQQVFDPRDEDVPMSWEDEWADEYEDWK
jgi:hypothetical protein